MNRVPAPSVLTCRQWGALPPKRTPIVTGAPVRGIFHHTDGHAAGPTPPAKDAAAQAVAYARALQLDMMDRRGWNDSGHNFLVMRSGLILQGRWGTITAIERGRMVVSAHCPGENDQPGIEHEHFGTDVLTREQIASSAALWAWICSRTGIHVGQYWPHSTYYPTSCPGSANVARPEIIVRASAIISKSGQTRKATGVRAVVVKRAVAREVRRSRA